MEAYNAATVKLSAIEQDIEATKHRLGIARSANATRSSDLPTASSRSTSRAASDTLIEILLGSSSLDEILERVDAADRISSEDRRILKDVRDARAAYRAQVARLGKARREQKQVVAERADRRLDIEQQLAERQQLYSSIQAEIERLQAEERERQERLQAEAERRLAEQSGRFLAVDLERGRPHDHGRAGQPLRRGGRDRDAVPRRPVPWAGASPSGFDCSGFVMYVFAQVGVSLPHNSGAQYGYGVAGLPERSCSPAISSSSTGSATSASTSAVGSSSTRRTPATS